MKTQRFILLLAGCLFSLSACQAQAAQPQPAPTPGVAMADLEDMQRNLAEAQKAREKAMEEVNVREKIRMTPGTAIAAPNIRIAAPGSGFIGGPGRDGSVLLIPQKPIPAEEASQLCEDIRVMSMILEDAVGPNQPSSGFGYGGVGGGYGGGTGMIIRPGFISFGGQSSPEAIWLDGYGIVFTLEVDFPLVPPAETGEQPPANQEQKDEVWQRSLNRLKGVEPPAGSGEKPAVVFDPDRVEMLREKLTKAMRHASNIRNLESNDRIIVVVQGASPGHEPQPPAPTSVMTLQAAKRDIDAFADEKLTPDEFAKKVTVVIY